MSEDSDSQVLSVISGLCNTVCFHAWTTPRRSLIFRSHIQYYCILISSHLFSQRKILKPRDCFLIKLLTPSQSPQGQRAWFFFPRQSYKMAPTLSTYYYYLLGPSFWIFVISHDNCHSVGLKPIELYRLEVLKTLETNWTSVDCWKTFPGGT